MGYLIFNLLRFPVFRKMAARIQRRQWTRMESAVLVRRDSSPKAPGGKAGFVGGGRRLKRLLLSFALLSGVSLLFLLTRTGNNFSDPMTTQRLRLEAKDQQGKQTTEGYVEKADESMTPSSRGFLVMTSGCKIPDLDPMDQAVQKFVRFYALERRNITDGEDGEEVPPNCTRETGPPLVESNLTALYIIESALEHYNATDARDISCCYRPFHRVTADPRNYDYSADSKFEYDKECVSFQKDGTASVGDAEFVRVECRFSWDDVSLPLIYKDFHAFTPLEVALYRAAQKQRNVTTDAPATAPEEEQNWGVLILGIDAVSRLNFHRQLPKTKKVLDELGAVEFLGYNKVADNTFPNLVPLMSGLSEEELKNACWPTPKHKLDDCPWLWRYYASEGYLTGLGEDCAWMSTFNYVKVGFLRQPVHFYLRPITRVSEDEVGHSKRMNAKVCVGPRLTVQTVFGYVEKIAKTVTLAPESPPFFGLFWVNSLTHDYLNSAGYGDEPQARLIRKIASTGFLNRTLMLFLSDHGIRWGGIRETYQGRLEERLPFVFAVVPHGLREKYPSAVANLVRNARKRLTTPFDLHATLKDLLHPTATISAEAVSRRSKELLSANSTFPRSISLFLPVPESRTCADAGITPNWCGCHAGEKPVKTDDPMAVAAAGVMMDKVNEYLKPYPQCAKRTLVAVKSAVMSSPPETLMPSKDSKSLQDLALVVEANPGSALFEATVRIVPKEESNGNVSLEMAVAGTISRINRYGNQSVCVDEFHMKLYCYCGSI